MNDEVFVWRGIPGVGEPVRMLEWEGRSANEISSSLPQGVYTTLRTYHGNRCLMLDSHFARLEESAALSGFGLKIDKKWLRKLIRIANNLTFYENNRIRIQITKEPKGIGSFYILVEKLTTPSNLEYEFGCNTVTRKIHRENALAKQTQFIETAKLIRSATQNNVNEVLMVGEDNIILEGLSSNFFGVKYQSIYTADMGILKGITREILLGIIKGCSLQLKLTGVNLQTIGELEEAFITSTSRGVLPVVKIDDNLIGIGAPGPITKFLMQQFDEKIEELLEGI